MIRHGDIMLRPIEAPSAETLDQKLSTHWIAGSMIVLAEGERTGHSHALHGAGLRMARIVYQPNPILDVPAGAELRHQEHATIVVPPGWYEVIRQRVYTPMGPRTVRD